MKKVFLAIVLTFILTAYVSMEAQGLTPGGGRRQHDGFYLSLALGPVFGEIKDNVDLGIFGKEAYIYSGTGAILDVKIGGRVAENLLLHGTITSAAIPGPTVEHESTGKKETIDSDNSLGEVMFGAGLTYYFMPTNIFISGSVGLGMFTFSGGHDVDASDAGIGVQLKAGKEWWVGDDWGLGVAVFYSTTAVEEDYLKYGSNRFGVMFNATFN
ncbi:MAG: hypothetical protein ACM3U1_05645 [Chloroflexota bacterium]